MAHVGHGDAEPDAGREDGLAFEQRVEHGPLVLGAHARRPIAASAAETLDRLALRLAGGQVDHALRHEQAGEDGAQAVHGAVIHAPRRPRRREDIIRAPRAAPSRRARAVDACPERP